MLVSHSPAQRQKETMGYLASMSPVIFISPFSVLFISLCAALCFPDLLVATPTRQPAVCVSFPFSCALSSLSCPIFILKVNAHFQFQGHIGIWEPFYWLFYDKSYIHWEQIFLLTFCSDFDQSTYFPQLHIFKKRYMF